MKEVAVLAGPKKLRKGEVNVGLLIGLFIFILIGIVLLPVITSEVTTLTSGSTPQVTGTDATLSVYLVGNDGGYYDED